MLKLKYILGLILFFISSTGYLVAQATNSANEKSKPMTYILPDGKSFQIEKWDSLEQAWGKGRIMFKHNEADDKNSITHLVRVTDQMKQKSEAQKSQMESEFVAMLNKPAPDFELTDRQGKRWALKDLRGSIVVLNFWFTSCAPCIQELPELNTLVYMYGHGTAVFLALTFNDAAKVESFLKKHRFDYTLLPDSEQVDKKYHISSWPTSMVIDKLGNIKKIIQSSPKIREEIALAIEEASQNK